MRRIAMKFVAILVAALCLFVVVGSVLHLLAILLYAL